MPAVLLILTDIMLSVDGNADIGKVTSEIFSVVGTDEYALPLTSSEPSITAAAVWL